ncbi:MAG: hypothetical protein AAGA54_34115 [Myxococcota bacterium]
MACGPHRPRLPRWACSVTAGLCWCLGASAAVAAPAAELDPAQTKPAEDPDAAQGRDKGPPDGRAFAVGVEGAVLTTPPLRTRAVYIDPRFVGRSMALGGLGVFGRYRPSEFIGFDASLRTGSVRLRAEDSDTTVSSDQVMAEGAALLYLGRGEVSQFALSGGVGGLFHRVRYELDSGVDGTQTFGAFTVRVGAEAEFLVNRIAFVLSFRTYGVATPRSRANATGALFENSSAAERRAPVATFQTYLAGSAGIAYRF